jgi:ubiquinone/menaquinone biosynthesis C-methylase UbiE
MNLASTINESAAREAFDKQAKYFDELYGHDTIIAYKRARVWEHVERFLKPGSNILELNAGTGEDAIHFASLEHRVHATDISTSMQRILVDKVQQAGLTQKITNEICSFTELENLEQQGPYDHIFSNFAGLNCTADLDKVLQSFIHLVRPGGFVTLVILPKFCLWEFLLLFKGMFRTAFRRFSGKKGAQAHIDGQLFRCWYYQPSYLRKHLAADFKQVTLEGLCTIVPPSYIQNFAEKRPRLFKRLVKMENRWKAAWPWRSIGDYYVITLERKDT